MQLHDYIKQIILIFAGIKLSTCVELWYFYMLSMKAESLTHLTIQSLYPFLSITGCSFKTEDRSVCFQKNDTEII